ncbi:muscular LMNA-interacting protein isoform X2 [Amia ocellicauda]|uniref:muscular LMNA-interacting protein isoform X2 n=1 Tax=Amia ocellicauda TaxID=2972642 RepID=UPI003464B27F
MEMEKQESFMHVTEEDRQTVRSKTPTTKLLSFTFIPAVRRLPIKAQVIPRGDNGQPSGRSHEYLGLSRGKATEETMVEDGVFKAEIVYVGDSDEGEGDHREKHHTAGTQGDDSKKQGAQVQFNSPAAHMTPAQLTAPPITVCKENAGLDSNHLNTKHESTASDTLANEQKSILQPCLHTSLTAKIHSSLFSGQRFGKCEIRPQISDRFPSHLVMERFFSPMSSKESILSTDSDRAKSWSALHLLSSEGSQASLSRTVSPCSSVRSGAFTPTIVKVKRQSLASGSSLLQTPPHCLSPAPHRLTPGYMSPSATLGRSWHRPPPSQLSLLTAILRKGYLPHISEQRPFSPSWPHSPASLSSLNVCSVTSSLTSVSLEVSRSQSPTEMPSGSSPPLVRTPTSPSLNCLTPPPSPTSTESIPLCVLEHPLSQSPEPAKNLVPPLQNCPSFSSYPSPTASPAPPLSPAPNPITLCSPYSTLNTISPIFSSFSSCPSETHPVPSPTPRVTISRAPSYSEPCPAYPLQSANGIHLSVDRHSPSCLVHTLSPSPPPFSTSLSPCSPRSLSPRSISLSPIPTPNRLMLSPSPTRDFAESTPSPSLSSSSIPSPTPRCGTSELSSSPIESETRMRKQYKIKSSYKAFAAIPTNTLLLEQQAIDEEVERQILPEATGDGSVTETHAEMCSPAELRQQSAELYAAIDQVLDEPLPMRVTTLPRSAGRETKYATFHLLPPGPTERQLTKPGVIRPVSVTPRLPEEEEEEEEYRANPFRQYLEELSDGELQKPPHPIVTIHENEALSSKELTNTGSGFRRTDGSKSLANQKLGKETIPEKDSPTNELLQIIEREDGDQDQKSTLGTEGSTVSTFNSSQIKMELRETHI